MNFNSFNLNKDLINALNELGYIDSTEVQSIVIPRALKKESLIVKSPTGSGKTHSFLIPILNSLDFEGGLQALIIVPTKELAYQTLYFLKEFKKYYPKLRIKTLLSGIDYQKNIDDLESNSQIIIATPGRLDSLLNEFNDSDFLSCKTIVLDEVDMLSEKSFFDDIEKIISNIKNFQILLYSATIPQYIRDFLKKSLPNIKINEIDCSNSESNINQYFINTKHRDVFESIDLFLENYNPYILFIFSNSKVQAKEIYTYLRNKDKSCGIISGELDKRERKSMLKRIRNNEFQIVVCTDLASRGIDIQDISDVLSLDVPNNVEYYFHRIGRTGRIGKTGNAYLFYNNDTATKVKNLIDNFNVKPSFLKFNGDEIIEDNNPSFKEKVRKKKESEELTIEIKKAKARSSSKKVKPNYKKKVRVEIDNVKRRYRHKEIKKSIRKSRTEKYIQDAKNK